MTWLVRVGRLALARDAYQAVGGWRRLFWRVWWRTGGEEPIAAQFRSFEPLPLTPPKILHWVTGGENLPLCGATSREPWTIEFTSATCPACMQQGILSVIQYNANTR